MKAYPSIPHFGKEIYKFKNKTAYAFDKIDGSNIRAEWNNKKGFYKFGSRTKLITEDENPLGESISLIKNKYEEDISKIFSNQKIERAICFFEFWGENSSFGSHEDEDHTVTLIDVSVYKKGFLSPENFLKLFDKVDHAKLLWEGKIDEELIDDIKSNKLEGITNEGVVIKTASGSKNEQPLMIKVKTEDWYQKLREHCDGNQMLYKRLK